MELNLDKGDGIYIQSYDPGKIETNENTYTTSIIVTAKQIKPWRPPAVDELTEKDLLELLIFNPKIILIGTGTELKRIPPALLRCFIEKNIGYEIMNTAAACRTYNVLMTENRAVVAGLIV